jgi:2-phosphosulfolactate phosphatase
VSPRHHSVFRQSGRFAPRIPALQNEANFTRRPNLYPEGVPFHQAEFEVRCEWSLTGLKACGTVSDVVVIVDVLSFTTAVDVATARGGIVFPYPHKGESAASYAESFEANPASPDRARGFSLSPESLRTLPSGYRLVLPSPNGAALSFAADHPIVLAACLRNATAVARFAASLGSSIAVIPAGETWPHGELRPCLEDLLGAGAVVAAFPGSRSPEAMLAAAAFDHFREGLPQALQQSVSGKELIELGFAMDVDLAAELDVSRNVPRLLNGAFVAWP